MNKFLFLFLILTHIGFGSIAQEKIRWTSEDQLNWNDFKAKAEKGSMAAQTFTKTEMSMSYSNGQFQWTIDCYFSPEHSWVQADKKSDRLLNHEQLHFDIAELNTRKIRKEMSELKLVSIDDSKLIQEVFQDGLNRLSKMQEQYDKETNHGLLDGAQKKWNERINEELNDYRDFATSNYSF